MNSTTKTLPILLALAGASCQSPDQPTAETDAPAAATEAAEPPTDQVTLTAEELQLAGIRTAVLTPRVLGEGLKVNGVLDVPPDQLVAVSAPLGALWKALRCCRAPGCARGRC
ncbi:hypothetical protein [Hymenobacter cellulosilyticus]|uniref:Uncharacterized protein n=1 Tax=Hymenobacter cellulosilyticus TaxID=2932248 RepID=A0A8T9Q4S0_9BACT|nr:hypothetical protein [Hymenobacter cellulosilyticus]UOQ71431.1 hypothetical protein MUN79_22855 [Hymenobacter cellulosilyticus]